jgi:hypothetical protein
MSAIYDYFRTPTPEEQVKKWKQSTRGQIRELDKNLTKIKQEQTKTKLEIKKCAKVI